MLGMEYHLKVEVLKSRSEDEESPMLVKTGHRKRISFLVNHRGRICALHGAVRVLDVASALLAQHRFGVVDGATSNHGEGGA